MAMQYFFIISIYAVALKLSDSKVLYYWKFLLMQTCCHNNYTVTVYEYTVYLLS